MGCSRQEKQAAWSEDRRKRLCAEDAAKAETLRLSFAEHEFPAEDNSADDDESAED